VALPTRSTVFTLSHHSKVLENLEVTEAIKAGAAHQPGQQAHALDVEQRLYVTTLHMMLRIGFPKNGLDTLCHTLPAYQRSERHTTG
jgi:hypothetical protein